MSCEPKFESTIPVDCVVDVIQAVRGGQVGGGRLAVKATWVLGCVLTKFAPDDQPEIFAAGGVPGQSHADDRDAGELAAELEPHFKSQPAGGTDGDPAQAISPAVWAMLVQLLLQVIKNRQ